MLCKFSNKYFITALTIFSALVITSDFVIAQTASSRKAGITTFHCIRQNNGYATVARRGNRQTGAMITWNSKAFGPKFTPLARCQMVSQRLTKAVADGGGRLSTLKLTSGTVNSNPVICYITDTRGECNPSNLILTLNKSEFGQEEKILNQFKEFSVNGTGTPLSRAPGDGRITVRLGAQIENAFETNATEPVTPDASDTEGETR